MPCLSRGDIVITSSEFSPESSEVIFSAKRAGAITVQVADGILEWRNSFEHPPKDVEGCGAALWNPVLSDYFLALGDAQKRIVESLGNGGKCVAIGSPRLEQQVTDYHRRTWHREPVEHFCVLIASARKFGIGASDKEAMIRAFLDLRDFIRSGPSGPFGPITALWRVADELALELDLNQSELDSGAGNLGDVLERVDAVVTGPSTLMLEAMLKRKPVVGLDYTSSPQYVRTAWNIRAKDQIEEALLLANTLPSQRVLFQDTELADQIALQGSATARLDSFIEELQSGGDIELPQPEREQSSKTIGLSEKDAEIAQLRFLVRKERAANAQRIERLLHRIEEMKDQPGKWLLKSIFNRIRNRRCHS